jgi:hypothetical protein
MGTTKNSPGGCGCCGGGGGDCLNEDTRLWEGIEIRGVPAFTISHWNDFNNPTSLDATTVTTSNFSGTYLISAIEANRVYPTDPSGNACGIPFSDLPIRLMSGSPTKPNCCYYRWLETESFTLYGVNIDVSFMLNVAQCAATHLLYNMGIYFRFSCPTSATYSEFGCFGFNEGIHAGPYLHAPCSPGFIDTFNVFRFIPNVSNQIVNPLYLNWGDGFAGPHFDFATLDAGPGCQHHFHYTTPAGNVFSLPIELEWF